MEQYCQFKLPGQVPVVFSRSKEDSVAVLTMVGRQDDVAIDVVLLRGGYRPKKT